MSNSEFLKEMGITEWVSREHPSQVNTSGQIAAISSQEESASNSTSDRVSQGNWIFFGSKPQGDTQLLFQNIIRALGLAANEWSWVAGADALSSVAFPGDGSPVVAFAFGGSVAQKITGERDALPQLRETILALNTGKDEEIPVIASYDLSQALSAPKEKALLWQDLLLAKSVLQNT